MPAIIYGGSTLGIRDEVITGNVLSALNQDHRLGGQTISVRVSEGDVFLKGSVDSKELVELAELMCKGISGVRHVDVSELQVRG